MENRVGVDREQVGIAREQVGMVEIKLEQLREQVFVAFAAGGPDF